MLEPLALYRLAQVDTPVDRLPPGRYAFMRGDKLALAVTLSEPMDPATLARLISRLPAAA